MKKVLLISLLTLLYSTIKAQSISINGLEVGEFYTITVIEDSLGIPIKKSASEDEFGITYELFYQDDIFHFDSFAGFSYFGLTTNKYSVSGLFRVGDAVSVLSNIKNSRMELKEEGCYHFYLGHADDPIVISFKDGVITSIWYMMSV